MVCVRSSQYSVHIGLQGNIYHHITFSIIYLATLNLESIGTFFTLGKTILTGSVKYIIQEKLYMEEQSKKKIIFSPQLNKSKTDFEKYTKIFTSR